MHQRLIFFLFLVSFFVISCNTKKPSSITETNREMSMNESPGNKVSVIREGFIYDNAPFPECHASSIVELNDGKMMATWFGGTEEKDPDVTIWVSVYDNGNWGEIREVADGIQDEKLRYPCWNPVLFKHTSGKLFLFYKVGPNPREWWGEMMYSMNDGESWSASEKLPEGYMGPVRAKPIELANGNLLCPSSVEYSHTNWKVQMETYQPAGNTWQKIMVDEDADFDVIQPALLRHSDGQLQILCRSKQNRIVEAWSTDNGASWGKLSATNLPNPSAGIDVVTMPDNQHVLIYNPTEKGPNDRARLSLALSADGKTWTDIYKLEDEPRGEFSYPAMVQTGDGLIHITYTWNRQKIKHVVVKV